jgi:hypothetical protein
MPCTVDQMTKKKSMTRNLVLIGLAGILILAGCSTLSVAVEKTPAAPMSGVKTVLLDPVISDRVLPIFPLIDAGMCNAGVNEIPGPDLIKIDAQKSVELADAVDATYRDAFGSETNDRQINFLSDVRPQGERASTGSRESSAGVIGMPGEAL